MTDREKRKIDELKKIYITMGFSSIEIRDMGVPLVLFDEETTVKNLDTMIKFLKENPNATYDDIQDEIYIILGIEILDDEE